MIILPIIQQIRALRAEASDQSLSAAARADARSRWENAVLVRASNLLDGAELWARLEKLTPKLSGDVEAAMEKVQREMRDDHRNTAKNPPDETVEEAAPVDHENDPCPLNHAQLVYWSRSHNPVEKTIVWLIRQLEEAKRKT